MPPNIDIEISIRLSEEKNNEEQNIQGHHNNTHLSAEEKSVFRHSEATHQTR